MCLLDVIVRHVDLIYLQRSFSHLTGGYCELHLLQEKSRKNRGMFDWVELNWLFNVTINDISVIYVTAHRCAGGLKKKLDLRSGSQRHRHFVGFFNVPVLAPTRDQPFLYGDSDTPPHLVAFYDHAGDTEVHILDLTPRALTRDVRSA